MIKFLIIKVTPLGVVIKPKVNLLDAGIKLLMLIKTNPFSKNFIVSKLNSITHNYVHSRLNEVQLTVMSLKR
jgi:hypothetical protein